MLIVSCFLILAGGFALLPFLWLVNVVWFFGEAFLKPAYEQQRSIRKCMSFFLSFPCRPTLQPHRPFHSNSRLHGVGHVIAMSVLFSGQSCLYCVEFCLATEHGSVPGSYGGKYFIIVV